MILYSLNETPCRSGNCAPPYPTWARSENYEQCDGFCCGYSAPGGNAAHTLIRKAGDALARSLGRRVGTRKSIGPAEVSVRWR